MNAFQFWMHFYSFMNIIAWIIFILLGIAYLYAFQFKNNISFFCAHKHNCLIQNFE